MGSKPLTTKDTKEHKGEYERGGSLGWYEPCFILRERKNANHNGHPFDFPFASSGSLRAGYGTQR